MLFILFELKIIRLRPTKFPISLPSNELVVPLNLINEIIEIKFIDRNQDHSGCVDGWTLSSSPYHKMAAG